MFKERITDRFATTRVPLQLLSSQGKTQFCIPLHTREVLMHMLLWQKNALPTQGAEKRTQVYQYVTYANKMTKQPKPLAVKGSLITVYERTKLFFKIRMQCWQETTGGWRYKCICNHTSKSHNYTLHINVKWQRLRTIWSRNSRSAKDVNSIRKRLRRLASSAHILTTPTPVSSMMSLATVLQNLACKKPHTIFSCTVGRIVSLRPSSVKQLLYFLWFRYYIKRSMFDK